MPRIFISHSWNDNEICRKIAQNLKRDGAEIWIDYARISGGESLPERISEALEWCDTLVLVWSKSAAASKWVTKEWTAALSLDKTIIPCLLDDTKLPAILASLLYINFKNADAGYEELCRTLKLTTFRERENAEAEKLKLEQQRLEAERKEKEKLRRLQSEQELQEREKQLKWQAEQKRQKRDQERIRLQEAEREEQEKQRKLNEEKERQKIEQDRLQKFQRDKQRKDRIDQLKTSIISKKIAYAIFSVITIFWGIYIINTLLSSNSSENGKEENLSEIIAIENSKTNNLIFRSEPTPLSVDQVKAMLTKNGFFDSNWNKTAKGFNNQFETKRINGQSVVIDHASRLMWQQSGSDTSLPYNEAKEYVQELNRTKFAGFSDWRLPTLEEAMSLMEQKKLNGDLYINPIFYANQWRIWTIDPVTGAAGAQWVVFFSNGTCNYSYYFYTYVRAVRFGQSSP